MILHVKQQCAIQEQFLGKTMQFESEDEHRVSLDKVGKPDTGHKDSRLPTVSRSGSLTYILNHPWQSSGSFIGIIEY
jgi:hypothetical protein